MTRRTFIGVLSAMLAAPVVAHRQPLSGDGGLRAFEQSIDEYMNVRAAIERDLPRLEISGDASRIHAAVAARAEAIRRARAGARQGALFNAGVAVVFRARIQQIFAGRPDAVADLLDEMQEDGEPWSRPVVNGPFSWRTAVGTPPSIVAALPPLPDDLQYRFVGADLVLVDVDANLVLDILPDALPLRRGGWVLLRDPLTKYR